MFKDKEIFKSISDSNGPSKQKKTLQDNKIYAVCACIASKIHERCINKRLYEACDKNIFDIENLEEKEWDNLRHEEDYFKELNKKASQALNEA